MMRLQFPYTARGRINAEQGRAVDHEPRLYVLGGGADQPHSRLIKDQFNERLVRLLYTPLLVVSQHHASVRGCVLISIGNPVNPAQLQERGRSHKMK